MRTQRALRVISLGLFLLSGAAASSAQEKHALLVVGQQAMPAADEQVASALLSAKGYIVHPLRPGSGGAVTGEIARLAAISQDPNQPAWDRFAFYFIGHGGGGLMALNDLNDRESGVVFTDLVAQQIFTDVYADAFTFMFDMCESGKAVDHVWFGATASNQDPVGWILTASSLTGEFDEDSTYGTLFTDALAKCLGGMGLAVNDSVLGDCLTQERWFDPWWYKSLPMVMEVDPGQPPLPVF